MLVAVLTDLFQPWRLGTLALAVAMTGMFVAAPARMSAQADTVIVLATTLEAPVLEQAVELMTAAPTVTDVTVAGAPTTLARPSGDGPWPALVVVNGATERGRNHPALQRLARGLGRAGYLVLVPDLPGLARGEITDRTVTAALDVVRTVADRPDADQGRVGLVGVSVGTSLALLIAADPSLGERVTVVSGTAPYADLSNLIRLATTGYYRDGNLLIPYETDPFLAIAVARSLAGALPNGRERDTLRVRVDALDDEAADPLALIRSLPRAKLTGDTRAVIELLANDDPRRFDELYVGTPAELRAALERLSPIHGASRLTARVELASAPRDKYVPLAEARALIRAAPNARLTVTETLAHAVPEPTLGGLGDLFRFNGWVVRSLEAAGR
jgi:pimeloyl-ACP methyl ester carboxylesterase